MINVLLWVVGSKGGNKFEIIMEIYLCDYVCNMLIYVYVVDFIIFIFCVLICRK